MEGDGMKPKTYRALAVLIVLMTAISPPLLAQTAASATTCQFPDSLVADGYCIDKVNGVNEMWMGSVPLPYFVNGANAGHYNRGRQESD
jgi:hypothetical protein